MHQATGYAPIAAGRDRAGDEQGREANDLADGIQIEAPARGEQLLAAVEATDGAAIAVDADGTRRAHDRLSMAGFQVEPTCATAVAALETYRERSVVSRDDDVVVALSGQNG